MNEVSVDLCGRWPLVLPRWRQEHWATNPLWEEAHLGSMFEHVGPGDVVYDVGSELGDFPALFASWGCRVVPVEPSPWYWPAIREMFTVNELPDPIGSFWGFCDAETAYEESPRRPWPKIAHGPYSERQGFSNTVERPDLARVTIDDLARLVGPPDAISVDVEGAEVRVVYGARKTLRDHKPTLWLSEHPEMMLRDFGVSQGQLHAFIAEHGYESTLLGLGHEEWWVHRHPERA